MQALVAPASSIVSLHNARDEETLLYVLASLVQDFAEHHSVLFTLDVDRYQVYASTSLTVGEHITRVPAEGELWLPLVGEGQVLGALVLRDLFGPLPPELTGLGSHVALALMHLQSESELRRKAHYMTSQLNAFRATRALLGQLELDVLLAKLQELAVMLLTSEVGCVLLTEGEDMTVAVEWGLNRSVLNTIQLDGEPLVARLLRTGQVQRVEGWSDRITSAVLLPIQSRGEIQGALALVNRIGGTFTDNDIETGLTIAGIAGGAIQAARAHQAEVERGRMEASLRLAGQIQQRLLPADCPEAAGCALAGWSRPADESGGDFYDFFPNLRGRAVLCVGDVSGHGVAAALPMATTRAFIRAWKDRLHDPGAVMNALNDLLVEDLDAQHFVTLFLAMYDTTTGIATYASAGHEPALLFRRETGVIEVLEATGIPLGMFSGQHYETQIVCELSPGDILLAGTDGITEQANPDGELFGAGRLREVLLSSAEHPLPELIAEIEASLHTFRQTAPVLDDLTLTGMLIR